MKPVGKPDAGNPHVRFDERGRETERCPTRPKPPRPSSTLQVLGRKRPILTDTLGCTTPSAAYSLSWPLRQTEGRRDFFAVVDYNDTGMYEPDRITLFSPFGGFPVYSHNYDRLDQPPRMDRVRAVTEDMLRFSRKPAKPLPR